MWRSTPLHRSEAILGGSDPERGWAELPAGVSSEELQAHHAGYGPLFHRRYRTRVRGPKVSAEELMATLSANINKAAPTTFARFQKVLGERRRMSVDDEYVVRMPGPWDGPVRVIDVSRRSFRLATLTGHLEAGQIEFRTRPADDGELRCEIESWARSSGRLQHVLYHRLRMSKEIQAHMWISFLEGMVSLAGGRMTGGVEIRTRRFE